MNPDPLFDAVHPSGQLVFRSCRGGYLHNVVIGESAMDVDTGILARAILLAADVSHLKATMRVRAQIVDAGDSPSGRCRNRVTSKRPNSRCSAIGCVPDPYHFVRSGEIRR